MGLCFYKDAWWYTSISHLTLTATLWDKDYFFPSEISVSQKASQLFISRARTGTLPNTSQPVCGGFISWKNAIFYLQPKR